MTAPVALHGSLRDFGIAEVFQLIGQQRKTGVLEVRSGAREVALRFDAGCIVSASPAAAREGEALLGMLVRCGVLPDDALARLERLAEADADPLAAVVESGLATAEQVREIEDLLTRETLFELLRWEDGSFRFAAQSLRHDRAPDSLLGAEQVLMDGLRMVDEWRAAAGQHLPEGAVLRRAVDLEGLRAAMADAGASTADAERVFLLIDGRSSVRRILDLSRLGTFTGMRVLAELRRAGCVEVLPAATDGAFGPPREARLRSWSTALAPLLMLAALAAGPGPLRDVPGLPIGDDPIADARHRFDTVRTRRVVEAYRLAHGRWPESADEALAWAAEAEPALAPSGAAVYYSQRADGPLVLAR